MRTALLHLTIAVVWLLLSPQRDLPRLLFGLGIGWVVLALLHPLLPPDRYLGASLALFRWLWAFAKTLVLSQVRVAQIILLPSRYPIHPGFLRLPLDDLSDLEILLLSHSISLTPGTTTVDVDREQRELLIHALEADSPEETIAQIRSELLEPLLEFTRS